MAQATGLTREQVVRSTVVESLPWATSVGVAWWRLATGRHRSGVHHAAGGVVTVVTAADGTARAQVRAGALPGAATVTASTPLVARPAAFALTVEPPSADVSVAVDLPAVLDRHRDAGVRLTVRNAGPSPSGPWTAEVVVPHRSRLRDLGGGVRAGDVVRWSGASLPSGSSAERTLTVRPRGKGEVVVSGRASGTLVDPDPSDGTTSATATVGRRPVEVRAAARGRRECDVRRAGRPATVTRPADARAARRRPPTGCGG